MFGIVSLLLISILYAISAIDVLLREGDWKMAGVFCCYALANALLIAIAYREH